MTDSKLARKMSQSSASPYKTDIYVDEKGASRAEQLLAHAAKRVFYPAALDRSSMSTLCTSPAPLSCIPESAKSTGNLTVGECLRLAKTISDVTALPVACQEYMEKQKQIKKAYAGAGATTVRASWKGLLIASALQYGLPTLLGCTYFVSAGGPGCFGRAYPCAAAAAVDLPKGSSRQEEVTFWSWGVLARLCAAASQVD